MQVKVEKEEMKEEDVTKEIDLSLDKISTLLGTNIDGKLNQEHIALVLSRIIQFKDTLSDYYLLIRYIRFSLC